MPEKNKDLVGKKAIPVPVKEPEIGIDQTSDLLNKIIDGVEASTVDLNTIAGFDAVAQTRETTLTLIDSMACDDRVSAVLETYAEDATETNEHGQIVWCESSNDEVNKYVTYLINSLDIDKYVYKWVYSLVKYGDVYLRLYRESDYGDDLLFGQSKEKEKKLNESKEDSEDSSKEELKEDL